MSFLLNLVELQGRTFVTERNNLTLEETEMQNLWFNTVCAHV